ncbi:hypothetical protein DLAC_01435 [Tieghemostelium lacteum]|uniref:Elongin-A n=1 Tax=Tieghemostelium lacteum TaxID=361077 RepID=A0A152A5F1_TIELA|nr:hypothetical protein DLAC_01435 [Tieghemostelium lacteum]|eukprot:KYR01454.1 hypothetical protein DLAC_01435 [Tieghemostelium lacteum]
MDFGLNEIPTLFDICLNYIQPRLDSIKNLSNLNDDFLVRLLEKASPQQIILTEAKIGREISAEELWKKHCFNTSFVPPDYEVEEDQTWRSLYQQLTEQYEEKRKKTGDNLKKLYSSAENQRKSKQIKVLTEVVTPPTYRSTHSVPKTSSSSHSSSSTSSPRTSSPRTSSPRVSAYAAPPRQTKSTYSKPQANQPKLMAKILKQVGKRK